MTDNDLLSLLDDDIKRAAGNIEGDLIDWIKEQAMKEIIELELPISVLNDVCCRIIADLAYASILSNTQRKEIN